MPGHAVYPVVVVDTHFERVHDWGFQGLVQLGEVAERALADNPVPVGSWVLAHPPASVALPSFHQSIHSAHSGYDPALGVAGLGHCRFAADETVDSRIVLKRQTDRDQFFAY